MAEHIDVPEMRQTYVECDGCDVEEEVNWYCLSCKSNLCGTCKTARLHRKHIIKLWKDPEAVKARQDQSSPCRHHPGQIYGTYCTTCSCLSCPVCVAERHSGHHFATMQSVAERKREEAQKVLDTLTSVFLPKTETSIEGIEKSISSSASESHTRTHQIKRRAQYLHTQIEQYEKQLLDKELNFAEHQKRSLKKQLSLAEERKRCIESFVRQIEKDLQLGNNAHFILCASEHQCLSTLLPPEISLPVTPIFREADFQLPEAKECIGTMLIPPMFQKPPRTRGETVNFNTASTTDADQRYGHMSSSKKTGSIESVQQAFSNSEDQSTNRSMPKDAYKPLFVTIEHIPIYVKKLLCDSEQMRAKFDKLLQRFEAKVDWKSVNKQSSSLVIQSTFVENTSKRENSLRWWTREIQEAVGSFIDPLTFEECFVSRGKWTLLLNHLRSLNIQHPENVSVIVEKDRGCLVVVGHREDVKSLCNEIERIFAAEQSV